MGFAVESQELKELLFAAFLGKTNDKIFNAFFAQIWVKTNYPQKSSSVTF